MNYNPLFGTLDNILQEDTLIGKRFALLELVLLLLGLFLVKNCGLNNLRERSSRKIFYISLIVVFICFINPNNSFDDIKYILSYQPRILIFFIFLLFIFMSVTKQGLTKVMYYFINYGIIIAVSQAVISTISFISGNGVKFLGSATTIPHAEIVNVMIIFCAVSLSLYLSSQKRIYLFLVLLFHITIFFADRRTPLAILLIIDLMVFYYYRKTGSKLLTKCIAASVLMVVVFYFLNEKTAIDIEYFILRIYAVFGGSIKEYGDNFTDMGHWEQTALTFSTMFSNLDVFWGGGLRNYMFFVYGQSAYIHNSFAAVWAYYGIPMTIFLIYILYLFVMRSFKYLRESSKKYDHPLLAPIVFSYMMILVGDAFTGEYFSKHFVYTALFVWILSFLRLNNIEEMAIYKLLINYNK